MNNLLKDFEGFFTEYLNTWNECDVEKLSKYLSKDMVACSAQPDNKIHMWGYNESYKGWGEVYEFFKGHNPKWHIDVLHITPIDEDKVMALFWVGHSTNGKLASKLCLYCETFQKKEDTWKLIRTYSENSLPSEYVLK